MKPSSNLGFTLIVGAILLIPILGRAQAPQVTLVNWTIEEDSSHEIRGGGITPSDLDWDDSWLLANDDARKMVFRELGASVVRVVLPNTVYAERDGGNGTQTIPAVDKTI